MCVQGLPSQKRTITSASHSVFYSLSGRQTRVRTRSLFYRCGHWCSVKLHGLPKVTQLLNVGVGVKTGLLTPRAASFIGFPKQVIEVPPAQSNQG